MKKKELLAGQAKLLREIAALREENLQLRRQLSELPESIPEPPVPDDPENEITPQHLFSRFPLLRSVDEQYNGAVRSQESGIRGKDEDASLAALAAHLRGYAAAHFGLCAPLNAYASLLGAMAASDFVLLYGEQAAALLQAAAAALGQEAQLIPARQPLLGAQDAVTKLYKETRLLRILYEAGYQSSPCFAVLEGTLPEALSSLFQAAEPTRTLRLVSDAWPGDPILLTEGTLKYPENLWLFCPIPEHISMPQYTPMQLYINIKETAAKEIPDAREPMDISAKQLRALFTQAPAVYPVPGDIRARFAQTAAYLADHLDISIDARTERQMPQFVSVCLACGLPPKEALDAFFFHRALRRMEYADPPLLRYELPGFQRFLDETFGRNSLPLTNAFTKFLQKND